MGTWRGALYFDPAVGPASFVRYDADNSPMPGGRTLDVGVAPDGTVWFACFSVAGARADWSATFRRPGTGPSGDTTPRPTAGPAAWSATPPWSSPSRTAGIRLGRRRLRKGRLGQRHRDLRGGSRRQRRRRHRRFSATAPMRSANLDAAVRRPRPALRAGVPPSGRHLRRPADAVRRREELAPSARRATDGRRWSSERRLLLRWIGLAEPRRMAGRLVHLRRSIMDEIGNVWVSGNGGAARRDAGTGLGSAIGSPTPAQIDNCPRDLAFGPTATCG